MGNAVIIAIIIVIIIIMAVYFDAAKAGIVAVSVVLIFGALYSYSKYLSKDGGVITVDDSKDGWYAFQALVGIKSLQMYEIYKNKIGDEYLYKYFNILDKKYRLKQNLTEEEANIFKFRSERIKSDSCSIPIMQEYIDKNEEFLFATENDNYITEMLTKNKKFSEPVFNEKREKTYYWYIRYNSSGKIGEYTIVMRKPEDKTGVKKAKIVISKVTSSPGVESAIINLSGIIKSVITDGIYDVVSRITTIIPQGNITREVMNHFINEPEKAIASQFEVAVNSLKDIEGDSAIIPKQLIDGITSMPGYNKYMDKALNLETVA